MVEFIGLLGAVLLPLAWLLHTYRAHATQALWEADPRIPALYALASILLLYHAFQLQDLAFIVLGLSMAMFTSTELLLLLRLKYSGEE
jgi:hypothetical protein